MLQHLSDATKVANMKCSWIEIFKKCKDIFHKQMRWRYEWKLNVGKIKI